MSEYGAQVGRLSASGEFGVTAASVLAGSLQSNASRALFPSQTCFEGSKS